MYIISNALKNLARYRVRYIIFGVLLFAAAAVGITASGIYGASVNISQRLKDEFGGVLYVFDNYKEITPEQARVVAGFSRVKGYKEVRARINCFADQLSVNGSGLSGLADTGDGEATFYIRVSATTPRLTVYGIDFNADIHYNAGNKILLKSGRLPKTHGEGAISAETLAALGGDYAGIGDTITLCVGSVERSFTVVGIYDDAVFSEGAASLDESEVFCPFITTIEGIEPFCDEKNIAAEYESRDYYTVTDGYVKYTTYFYLDSSEDYDGFGEWLLKLNGKNGTAYHSQYVRGGGNEFAESYDDTLRIARFFITAIFIVCGALVTLMAVLSMNERRYEIGVYLSIGMSKVKIWLLFACELLFYIFAVFIPGLIAGLIMTPYAYSTLIRGSLRLEGAAVDFTMAMLIFAVAVGLVMLSSAVCTVSILRYPPMLILRERN